MANFFTALFRKSSNGSDSQKPNTELEFISSIKQGDDKTAKTLLDKEGFSSTIINDGGNKMPVLTYLAKNGKEMLFLYTLNKDTIIKDIINQPDAEGNTALLWSVKNQFTLDTLNLLINQGADIKLKNNAGETVLDYAHSNNEVLSFLLSKTDSIAGLYEDGYPPLQEAINAQNYIAIEQLLSKGASANYYTSANITPLMDMVQQKQYNIVEILLKYNTDPNMKNDAGETALHMAAKGQDKQMFKLLTYYKGALDIKDNQEKVPLDYFSDADAQQIYDEAPKTTVEPLVQEAKSTVDKVGYFLDTDLFS